MILIFISFFILAYGFCILIDVLIVDDTFSWFRDEEFCRQMLAGLNPYTIQLVTEWPLTSKLDPQVYGPPESAITTEIVEQEIKGFMTLEQVIFKTEYGNLMSFW